MFNTVIWWLPALIFDKIIKKNEAILCKYYSKTAFYHKMIDTYSGEPLVFMGEGLFLYLE
jgi:hypothetical protein